MTGPRRPQVSVCIVTYNHARYIADCLLSVLSQDVDADLRVIVGDDGSSDGTSAIVAEIAAAWPGKVEHTVHAERHGPIGNLRFTVGRAEGDYIAHLDGDDFWLPGKLREQLALLADHPESPACCTNAFVFDDARRAVGVFTNAQPGPYDLEALLVRGNFLNHSSLLYRASHRSMVLALPDPFIDYRIHLGLAQSGPMLYTDKVLAGYRAGAVGSMLATANESVRERYFEAIAAAVERVPGDVRMAACADMLRRVTFRAIASRSPALLRSWWPRLRALAGGSSSGLIARASAGLAAEACRQSIQIVGRALLRSRLRVLYFR
ncbi:glycosyltransferase [Bacillus sp. NP157]|nr:glycosyltransferase [Bacillus sp. NP157]